MPTDKNLRGSVPSLQQQLAEVLYDNRNRWALWASLPSAFSLHMLSYIGKRLSTLSALQKQTTLPSPRQNEKEIPN